MIAGGATRRPPTARRRFHSTSARNVSSGDSTLPVSSRGAQGQPAARTVLTECVQLRIVQEETMWTWRGTGICTPPDSRVRREQCSRSVHRTVARWGAGAAPNPHRPHPRESKFASIVSLATAHRVWQHTPEHTARRPFAMQPIITTHISSVALRARPDPAPGSVGLPPPPPSRLRPNALRL